MPEILNGLDLSTGRVAHPLSMTMAGDTETLTSQYSTIVSREPASRTFATAGLCERYVPRLPGHADSMQCALTEDTDALICIPLIWAALLLEHHSSRLPTTNPAGLSIFAKKSLASQLRYRTSGHLCAVFRTPDQSTYCRLPTVHF